MAGRFGWRLYRTFFMAYTESAYLLLTVLLLLAVRARNATGAGLASGLLTVTRPTGVVAIPYLAAERLWHARLAFRPGLDLPARTRILAVLDTLEFVKRGGRIGGARAMLGNMLSVKPIISLKNGEVVPVEQPRTRSKAYARIAQLVREMGSLEHFSVAESSSEVGQELLQALKTVYSGNIPVYKLGAVLGTHTGPGTVAISAVTANKERGIVNSGH